MEGEKGGSEMTNANKVTLPREVAEAINFLRNKIGVTNFGIIAGIAEGDRGYDEWATVEQYASDKPDTLLEALVNEYEVEKSPEELEAERRGKVKRYYENIKDASNGDDLYDAQAYAIESTLDLLGIKIEGVNANE
jgi:hypothetical protein